LNNQKLYACKPYEVGEDGWLYCKTYRVSVPFVGGPADGISRDYRASSTPIQTFAIREQYQLITHHGRVFYAWLPILDWLEERGAIELRRQPLSTRE
jgi:hypothetical protein